MTILTGKLGYNSLKEFSERTDKALEGKAFFVKRDMEGTGPDWLTKHIPERASILDVGCGYGRLAKELEGIYGTYMGYDPVERRIEYARENMPGEFFSNWNEIGGPFDVVLLITVLQHLTLYDATEVLKSIKDRIHPESVILIKDAMIRHTTLEQCEKEYEHERPQHMIPKPITLFDELSLYIEPLPYEAAWLAGIQLEE